MTKTDKFYYIKTNSICLSKAIVTKPSLSFPTHSKPDTETQRFALRKVYLQGSQTRKQENKSQIHLPEGKWLSIFTG